MIDSSTILDKKIFLLYKIFTASDFVYELKKNIFKCNHAVQLFITEFELLALSNEIIDLLPTEKTIDIVISSVSQKKSLRLVNLFNRIVQSGGSVYWNENHELYQNGVHFMILDKTFVINKSDYYAGESSEEKIKYLNNLFDNFRVSSNEIKLITGQISIKLEAEKTFVERNKYVKLRWEVENAHRVSFENSAEELDHTGEMEILIKNDTIVKLEAENREKKLSKQLIIKVYKSNAVEITVEAMDKTIKEYLVLKGGGFQNEEYYAFQGQKIRLSWSIDTMGKFSEKVIGDLPLEGDYFFFLTHQTIFEFTYDSLYGTQKNKIVINPAPEELEEHEKIEKKQKKTLFGLVKDFSRFKKKRKHN